MTSLSIAMNDHFHFHLPAWPPQRLVREALISHNLRHLEGPILNPETSPWPLIRGAVLAGLRHQHSNYDDILRDEHNPELRDSLAAELAQAALCRYPWLAQNDPRPFPEPSGDTPSRLFTELARDLAHYHSLRDQLLSAIRDLKRQKDKQQHIAALEKTLGEIEQRIARNFGILTGPKYLPNSNGSGGRCRSLNFPHLPEEMGQYFFLDDRTITPNRYHFAGYRCPKCSASVVRLKQPTDWGQGFRMQVHSCFCHTLAIVCPPTGERLKPITRERWEELSSKLTP